MPFSDNAATRREGRSRLIGFAIRRRARGDDLAFEDQPPDTER